MWFENRFVATRDPSRGGLCITAATEGFSEQLKTEIYEECLEMAAKDYEHSCWGIYPLLNGRYAIMMAKKRYPEVSESPVPMRLSGAPLRTG